MAATRTLESLSLFYLFVTLQTYVFVALGAPHCLVRLLEAHVASFHVRHRFPVVFDKVSNVVGMFHSVLDDRFERVRPSILVELDDEARYPLWMLAIVRLSRRFFRDDSHDAVRRLFEGLVESLGFVVDRKLDS